MNARDICRLFSTSRTMIALLEADGKIAAANDAFLRQAGKLEDFLDEALMEELRRRIGAALEGGESFPLDATLNGTPCELRLEPLADCPDAALMLMIGDRSSAVERAGEARALQSFNALSSLANRVAHDMNNVLSGTLGFSSYLQGKVEAGGDLHKQLVLIEKAALRGQAITEQLLSFGRRRNEQKEEIALPAFLRTLCDELSAQHRIPIQLSLPEAPPRPLAGSASKLKTALTCLLVNALEATPAGDSRGIGVSLALSPLTDRERYLHSRACDRREYFRIAITDHGPGIPERIRPRVLEPYITTKTATAFPAVGIGLAVAQALILDHEGLLTFQREDNLTRVCVLLPCREVQKETSADAGMTMSPALKGSETILFIDDERLIRLVLSDMLPRFGYRVLAAPGGRQGLEIATQQKSEIDLILLDLNMPGFSGEETFDQLKIIAPEIPVLIFSGFISPAIRESLTGKGVRGFISKPFNNLDLLESIRAALDEGK